MFQLVYTSAPRLLEAGKTGFGTIARSRELPASLVGYLERISAYDRSAGVAEYQYYSLYRMGQSAYRIFSRVADCGVDYTRRTNHLAHHIIVPVGSAEDDALLRATSPAGVMLALQPTFLRMWSGTPAWVEPIALPTSWPVADTSLWTQLTGLAENTRHLSQADAAGYCLSADVALSDTQWLELLHAAMMERAAYGWDLPFCTAKVTTLNSSLFPLCCVDAAQKNAGVTVSAHLQTLVLQQGLCPPPPAELPLSETVVSSPPSSLPIPTVIPVSPPLQQPHEEEADDLMPADAEPEQARTTNSSVWVVSVVLLGALAAAAVWLSGGGEKEVLPRKTPAGEQGKPASSSSAEEAHDRAHDDAKTDANEETQKQAAEKAEEMAAKANEAAKALQQKLQDAAALADQARKDAEKSKECYEKELVPVLEEMRNKKAAVDTQLATMEQTPGRGRIALGDECRKLADDVSESFKKAQELAGRIKEHAGLIKEQISADAIDAATKEVDAAVELAMGIVGQDAVQEALDAVDNARKATFTADAAAAKASAEKSVNDADAALTEARQLEKDVKDAAARGKNMATPPTVADFLPVKVNAKVDKKGEIVVTLEYSCSFEELAEKMWLPMEATCYLRHDMQETEAPELRGGAEAHNEKSIKFRYPVTPEYKTQCEELERLRALAQTHEPKPLAPGESLEQLKKHRSELEKAVKEAQEKKKAKDEIEDLKKKLEECKKKIADEELRRSISEAKKNRPKKESEVEKCKAEMLAKAEAEHRQRCLRLELKESNPGTGIYIFTILKPKK